MNESKPWFLIYLKNLGGEYIYFSHGENNIGSDNMSYKEKIEFHEKHFNVDILPKRFWKHFYNLGGGILLDRILINKNGCSNLQSKYFLQCINTWIYKYTINAKKNKTMKWDDNRSEIIMYMLNYFKIFLDANKTEIVGCNDINDNIIHGNHELKNNEYLFSYEMYSVNTLASKIMKLNDQRETRMAIYFFDVISLFNVLNNFWDFDTKVIISKMAMLRK